jgi:hypothetical protein
MPLNRDFIGRAYPPVAFEVTEDGVRAFADSIHDPSPAFRGPDAIAPPTYTTIPAIAAAHRFADEPALNLDWASVLHGDQEFEWHAPLAVGQAYEAATTILDIRGRYPLEFITLETLVTDAQGEIAVRSRSTLIARAPEDDDGDEG